MKNKLRVGILLNHDGRLTVIDGVFKRKRSFLQLIKFISSKILKKLS